MTVIAGCIKFRAAAMEKKKKEEENKNNVGDFCIFREGKKCDKREKSNEKQ